MKRVGLLLMFALTLIGGALGTSSAMAADDGGTSYPIVASGGPVPPAANPSTGTPAAATPAAPAAVASEAPVAVAASSGALPTTGANSMITLQIAIALAAGGAILLVVARTRRQHRVA